MMAKDHGEGGKCEGECPPFPYPSGSEGRVGKGYPEFNGPLPLPLSFPQSLARFAWGA